MVDGCPSVNFSECFGWSYRLLWESQGVDRFLNPTIDGGGCGPLRRRRVVGRPTLQDSNTDLELGYLVLIRGFLGGRTGSETWKF